MGFFFAVKMATWRKVGLRGYVTLYLACHKKQILCHEKQILYLYRLAEANENLPYIVNSFIDCS